MFDPRKLIAEFIGTAILVFVAVGTATLVVRVQVVRDQLLGRCGHHRAGLRSGADGPRLRHRAHLGMSCEPGGLARIRGGRPDEGYRGRWGTGWPRWPAASPGPTPCGRFSPGRPCYSKNVQGLGADGYGSASRIHLAAGSAFAVEAILTFIFVMVILFATSKVARGGLGRPGHRGGAGVRPPGRASPSPVPASTRPAASGRPWWSGELRSSQLWLFIVAPLVGGFIAAMVYGLMTRNATMDVPADAVPPDDGLSTEQAADLAGRPGPGPEAPVPSRSPRRRGTMDRIDRRTFLATGIKTGAALAAIGAAADAVVEADAPATASAPGAPIGRVHRGRRSA